MPKLTPDSPTHQENPNNQQIPVATFFGYRPGTVITAVCDDHLHLEEPHDDHFHNWFVLGDLTTLALFIALCRAQAGSINASNLAEESKTEASPELDVEQTATDDSEEELNSEEEVRAELELSQSADWVVDEEEEHDEEERFSFSM